MNMGKLLGVSHWPLVIGHWPLGIKNRPLSLFFLFLLGMVTVTFLVTVTIPKFVFAGASVSVSGGAWDLGTKAASSESTSAVNNWTVTNDNTGGTEDVLIKVASTGTWTASTDGSQTPNVFVLRKDNNSGQIITDVNVALTIGLVNNGTYSFGIYFKAPPSGSEEGGHTLTVTLTAANWVFVCGNDLTVDHTAGAVAPVTKTVTYGTVTSSLSGASKCWITQNLGADNQASSADDAAEASAGWYWQFNRQQGYKYDTALTPSAWDTANDNTYTGWDPAKDPCTLLLGAGWRLPTNTEWTNAASGWSIDTDTYNSVLKLHAAGCLNYSNGVLDSRGSAGDYWSSTQYSSTNGCYLSFSSSHSAMYDYDKSFGFSVRCLKD